MISTHFVEDNSTFIFVYVQILEYVTKATTVSGLNTQQQIECMLEGALIFHRLGMRRKYGFYLYATILLCMQCDNLTFAQSLVS